MLHPQARALLDLIEQACVHVRAQFLRKAVARPRPDAVVAKGDRDQPISAGDDEPRNALSRRG